MFNLDNKIILFTGAGIVGRVLTQGLTELSGRVTLANLKIRCVPLAVDWNKDGKLDLIVSNASGKILLLINQGTKGNAKSGEGNELNLPFIPYSSRVLVADWNGDGDDDIIIQTGYQYFCWLDKSYLRYGYAKAHLVRLEEK